MVKVKVKVLGRSPRPSATLPFIPRSIPSGSRDHGVPGAGIRALRFHDRDATNGLEGRTGSFSEPKRVTAGSKQAQTTCFSITHGAASLLEKRTPAGFEPRTYSSSVECMTAERRDLSRGGRWSALILAVIRLSGLRHSKGSGFRRVCTRTSGPNFSPLGQCPPKRDATPHPLGGAVTQCPREGGGYARGPKHDLAITRAL